MPPPSIHSALKSHEKPDIFNSDQDVQFTSQMFVSILEAADISISMDARGRCFDNIFTERLWRSLKYEEVYIKDYASVADARSNLENYFRFYNFERLHQSLGYQTPAEIHFSDSSQKLLISDEKLS